MTYGERVTLDPKGFSKHQGWRQWAKNGKLVQVGELTEIAFENWKIVRKNAI